MSAKTGCFALFLSVFLSLPALAADCHFSGTKDLKIETSFDCPQGDNVILEADLHIITHGKQVIIEAEHAIVDHGATYDVVVGNPAEHVNGVDAKPIIFKAETISGACKYIHNNGYKNGYGSDVKYDVMSYNSAQFGQYKCLDIQTHGAGQGAKQAGRIIPLGDTGEIPFPEFEASVMK